MDGEQARRRIEDMEGKHLNFDEKIQLKALKNSSKRLEDKIFAVNTEHLRRRITINLLWISKEKTSSNEKPGVVAPQFLAIRCWEENKQSTDQYTVQLDLKQAVKAKQYMDVSASQKDRVYELKEKLECKRNRKQNALRMRLL